MTLFILILINGIIYCTGLEVKKPSLINPTVVNADTVRKVKR